MLELIVGTHTGWVPFRVELHEAEPPLDPYWEDVVEVSFTTASDEAHLIGLMGDAECPFRLPSGEYRVRFCAKGLDQAHHSDDAEDAYLLQFWLAPSTAGRILVQTSGVAAYWHRVRRTLTTEEHAEDARRDAEERERRTRARWGDRVPNERLRATLDQGLWSSALTRLDPGLEFALAEADDVLHRRIAAWVALRCLDLSGMTDLREFAPAVSALRSGEPVPPPFHDSGECWTLLRHADPPRTTVPVPLDGEGTVFAQDWALPTLFLSVHEDSLLAVWEVVVCLAHIHGRDGYLAAFAGLRACFPEL